jgi:LSD1 subclass zinc finger protein
MSVATERCIACNSMVDVEDLFCPTCGREAPEPTGRALGRLSLGVKNFECRNCGATMSYDAGARDLKCPFCASVDLVDDGTKGILAPDCVLPFALDVRDAEKCLRDWLGSSVWHPGDLKSGAKIAELRRVYVPFWVVATDYSTRWTADTSDVAPGSRASWAPIRGEHEGHYDDLWVPASEAIPLDELDAIQPFDIEAGVPPDKAELEHATIEQFARTRRQARPLVQRRVEELEVWASARRVPGQARNVRVNVVLSNTSSRAALAPVYMLAYRYRDTSYRFLVNGQTGRSAGTSPVSAPRVAGAVAAVIAIIVLLIWAASRFS